jgi:hypothetical protein
MNIIGGDLKTSGEAMSGSTGGSVDVLSGVSAFGSSETGFSSSNSVEWHGEWKYLLCLLDFLNCPTLVL